MAENALGCAQSRQFRTTSISRLGSQAMFATKQEVSYIGKQRYIRAALTTSGATTGAVLGADVITSGARKQPQ